MYIEVESGLNEELDRLNAVVTSQGEQIASFNTKMTELKRKLKRKIKEVSITRSEASFQFELANVRKFFEVVENRHRSDNFWCKGLKFWMEVVVKLENNVKRLGFYLHCDNEDSIEWSCKLDYKLILFSNLPDNDYVFREERAFNGEYGYGSDDVTYSELIDKKSGYLKNDTIRLGVQVKAGPVVKKSKGSTA